MCVIPPSPDGRLLSGTLKDLIGASAEVAVAVRNVRIAALGSIAELLPGVQRCRLVVAHLDARALGMSGDVSEDGRMRLTELLAYARADQLEVRSAAAERWEPDLSLFRFHDSAHFDACLMGAHYLMPLDHGIDWPLTCAFSNRTAVARAEAHFESLWNAAHDVRTAVVEALEQCLCG